MGFLLKNYILGIEGTPTLKPKLSYGKVIANAKKLESYFCLLRHLSELWKYTGKIPWKTKCEMRII